MLGMTRIVFSFQVENGKQYKFISDQSSINTAIVNAARGIIYDSNGKQLVDNKSTYAAYIQPQLFKGLTKEEQNKTLNSASQLLGMPAADMKSVLDKNDNQAEALLKNNISYDQIGTKIIADPTSYQAIKVKASNLREYVDPGMYSHILGYTGTPAQDEIAKLNLQPEDDIGKDGLEYTYDSTLRGRDGTKIIEKDATGKDLPENVTQEPKTGQSLGLAIDSNVQKSIADSLTDAIKKSGADGGAGIIERIDNGDIVGMVSLPTYDNNMFAKGISSDELAALYNDPDKPSFNRTIQGGYAPGSTFKTITATTVLSEKAITKDTIFNTGIFHYKDTNFYDYNKLNYGSLNIIGGLCRSSNIFFMNSANALDKITNDNAIDYIDDFAAKFGLGQKTGIDLPAESAGVMSSVKYTNEVRKDVWLPGYLMNTVIGQQDTLVSPIQMANWMAAIANNGTLYQPRIVNRMIDSDTKESKAVVPKVIRQNIADPKVLEIVKEGMRCSASQGAAAAINTNAIQIAAKTGTAEFGVKLANGEYEYSQAWVTGFFPYDHPKYSFSFLLEKGGLSSGAAFAAKNVIEWMAKNYSDLK